jgi:hypothetical protein
MSHRTKKIIIISVFLISIPIVIFLFIVSLKGAIYKYKYDKTSNKIESTQSQIKQMQENGRLCFHDSDCWIYGHEYGDCNAPLGNRYYCEKNGCATTLIGCLNNKPFKHYCNNGECAKK